jgi:hypothetical protein
MTSGDSGMETPLAPIELAEEAKPAPASPRRGRRGKAARKKDAKDGASKAPGTLGAAVRWGLSYALSARRVLFFVLLVQLALALTVVLPFWAGIAPHLDNNPHAPALAGSPNAADQALGWEAGLDTGIWRDIQREEKSLFDALTVTHFWIAVVAWLFGALVAGGFLGTSVTGERPVKVGRFLTVGAKHYGRMLRVGIVFALAYYVCARIVFEAWGTGAKSSELMEASEGAGWWADRAREAVFVLLFLWFRVAGDLARADLVVYSRTSALGAFLRGLGGALRLRSWGTALLIGLPAFVLLLVLALAARALTGDSWLVLLGLFLVFELAVLVRWASRAAVVTGLAHLVEQRRR